MILIVILTLTGFALLKSAEGKMIQAIRIKSQESASAAAEAGYEKAVFWMSQQADIFNTLQGGPQTGSLAFEESNADYNITLSSFIGSRPIFKVQSSGNCGIYEKTIEAYVVQAVAGWEMGQCRVPSSINSTTEVSFFTGEILDIPIHINNLQDTPDKRDIYISGTPSFLQNVSMGEDRYTTLNSDKYSSVMNLFQAGIVFNQPASRINDADSIAAKAERFRSTTNPSYCFTPAVTALPKSANGRTGFYSATVTDMPAVQLKFYVNASGQGYVRIYNNCTVAGYTRTDNNTWDYKIDPDSDGESFVKYPIYGCHYSPATYTDVRIDDPSQPIYVQQSIGGSQSQPGAQIYVNGNVIIGCDTTGDAALGTLNTIKGQVAIVASGNIWLAGELKVDGVHDADGMPSENNPNIIGLIAQGVVKVVDSGLTRPDTITSPLYNPDYFVASSVANYRPIGSQEGALIYDRALPRNLVIEAAITVGGGGWGAENVTRSTNPGRETATLFNDSLIVRGSITEAFRGVVGLGSNGYLKKYYYDERLVTGILPGNMGLKGKYLVVPGGWSEVASIQD